MTTRRFVLAGLLGLTLVPVAQLAAASTQAPTAIVQNFYDTLLATMKEGKKLGFAGRRDKLAPAIDRTFNLPLMTRLMVGPQWSSLTATEQTKLVDAFTAFSVATYASRFDDYSGERFVVSPAATPTAGGAVIVDSKLVPQDGKPVELDYLLRQGQGGWRIIDVYLSGTISELAARRSEFSSVLRREGAAALVNLLRQKTAQLSG